MEDLIVVKDRDFRDGVMKFQDFMCDLPSALIGDSPEYLKVNPTKHTFADGCYIREVSTPKGYVIVSKIHKKAHPFFLMKGDVSVFSEEGEVRLIAPFAGITKAGTKRVIVFHEDTTWITIHVTKETDLSKIEDEIIAKDFDELDGIIDMEKLLAGESLCLGQQ